MLNKLLMGIMFLVLKIFEILCDYNLKVQYSVTTYLGSIPNKFLEK